MTTLEDLYYGNIVPHEHSFKRGSAYSEVLSYVIRHQDSLIPTLTAQQKETFEKLKDCEAELHGRFRLSFTIYARQDEAGWICCCKVAHIVQFYRCSPMCGR